MKLRRALRWFGAFAGLLVLLCAGLIAALLAVIHPEEADPAIVRQRPAARVVRNVETGCAVVVTVTDIAGAPIVGADVVVLHGVEEDESEGRTDVSGRLSLPVACGPVAAIANAEGHAPNRAWSAGPTGGLAIVLTPGIRVFGTVTDPEGDPIAGAEVKAGLVQVDTDSDGAYALWVSAETRWVGATAEGFAFGSERIPEEGERRVDLELEPQHQVRVWCAGLPDERCPDIPVQCTDPWLLLGAPCSQDDEGILCVCPDGEAAVRGAGRSVRVGADDTDAWLDMRDTGAIVGRALLNGEPTSCNAAALRIPEALEDLPRGLVAASRGDCQEDGTFRIDGLIAGDWEVRVEVWGEDGRDERVLVPRRVLAGEVVDVGDVEVTGGAVLSGIVVDGLTGDPVDEVPVLAWRTADPGGRLTPSFDETNDDGTFEIRGIPGGEWTVAPMLAPQASVTVTVPEGGTRSGLRIETSEATALVENGFALESEGETLVVSDVTPESPADDAGLVPGDVVTGVQIAGFELSAALGDYGDLLTRAVIGHWDGPGVTLVVESPDGGEELVPLEW